MTTYDPQFASVLSSLDEDGKETMRADIRTIVTLATKARQEGLLALDEDAESATPGLLKLGLRLVVDGTDPEIVQRACWVAIHSGGFSGLELIRRLVFLDGILGVQAGNNPRLLAGVLSAYLGEEEALAAMDPE